MNFHDLKYVLRRLLALPNVPEAASTVSRSLIAHGVCIYGVLILVKVKLAPPPPTSIDPAQRVELIARLISQSLRPVHRRDQGVPEVDQKVRELRIACLG